MATFSGAMPMPVSATSTISEWSSAGTVESVIDPPVGNRIARIEHQVREHLLQLAGVAENLRRIRIVVANDFDLTAAQLRLEQLQRVVQHATDVDFA